MANPGFGPAVFQKFATRTTPATVAARLKSLRKAIAAAELGVNARCVALGRPGRLC